MITPLVVSMPFILYANHDLCVCIYLYNSAFIYNYGMYRLHDNRSVSVYTIGCYQCGVLLVDCLLPVVTIHVDII